MAKTEDRKTFYFLKTEINEEYIIAIEKRLLLAAKCKILVRGL